jgi:hypothetical protein
MYTYSDMDAITVVADSYCVGTILLLITCLLRKLLLRKTKHGGGRFLT